VSAGNTITLADTVGGGTDAQITGGFTKAGPGTLVLSGANSYVGGTAVTGGTLSVAADANLGAAGAGLTLDGGTLQVTGTAFTTTARPVSLGAGGGTFDVAAAANTLSLTAGVTGGGGLTKSGAGTLVLANAANSYTGGTTVAAGVLSIAADGALGATSGALTLNGGTLQFTGTGAVTALNLNRSVVLGSSGGTIDTSGLGAGFGNVTTVASPISGSGPLTLMAHGDTSDSGGRSNSDLILTGPNTFTGTVTIASGMVDAASNFGDAGNAIVITGGGLVVASTITASVNRAVTLAGTGDRIFRAYDGQTLTVGGPIGGTGALRKTDTGTLVLTGANTYAGGTMVAAGTLLANNSSGSATGFGPVTVGTGAANSGTLGGTGAVAGLVTVQSGGTVAPGNGAAPGMLFAGSGVALNSGSTLSVVAGNNTGASRLVITGALDLSGNGQRTIRVVNDGSFVFGQTYTYTIASMSSTTNFAGTTWNVLPGNFFGFSGTPTVTNPGGTALQLSFTPVPEPAAVLGVCALAALGWVAFWRRRWAGTVNPL
jgi:autotransporter-associated beta strand protein